MSRPLSYSVAAAQRNHPLGRALLFSLLFTAALAEVNEPVEKAEERGLPLPRWSEQELKTFRDSLPVVNSPGVLLPKNGEITDINELINTPLPSGPRLDHAFNSRDGELSSRLQAEDMRLFLPEAILGLPTQSPSSPLQLPTPLAALREVPAEFLAACAQSLPKEYLIDPDQLVPEIQNHDMTRLLEFHAHDARIKLYVLMIGHDQKLPEAARLDQMASGSLRQSDACLLVYPLGEPWRTRLFVSSSIHNQISTEFLSETIQACLREALETSNVHDQLRQYTIHLSTRLFWLQKALGANSASKDKDQTLAEFNPHLQAPATASSTSFMSIMIWGSSGVLLVGLTGITGRKFLHHMRLRKRRRIWMLAETDTVPRLGGAFTGGGGGMIRYS